MPIFRRDKALEKILSVYLICFLGWIGWVYSCEAFLSQVQPTHIQNRLDLTLNLLLSTGIHEWLVNQPSLCYLLDILFLIHPLILLASVRLPNFARITWVVVAFNLCYALLGSCYTLLSIQLWIGWFFIPLLFTTRDEKSTGLYIEGMRYAFLLIFLSAGLWKIRAGGIFDTHVMSGVLITQHATELALSPDNLHTQFIALMIKHPLISYTLYFLGTMIELSFFVGLFTKKWDRLLSWGLIFFIIMDILLMRINYAAWLAFVPIILEAKKVRHTANSTPLTEQ